AIKSKFLKISKIDFFSVCVSPFGITRTDRLDRHPIKISVSLSIYLSLSASALAQKPSRIESSTLRGCGFKLRDG
ncbi:MAG: hypothetical protein ACK559_20030, partial [bacterium]